MSIGQWISGLARYIVGSTTFINIMYPGAKDVPNALKVFHDFFASPNFLERPSENQSSGCPHPCAKLSQWITSNRVWRHANKKKLNSGYQSRLRRASIPIFNNRIHPGWGSESNMWTVFGIKQDTARFPKDSVYVTDQLMNYPPIFIQDEFLMVNISVKDCSHLI